MWFAVNALATAQAMEFKVDPNVWTRLIPYLQQSQHKDGGWNYVPSSSAKPTGSMTYAGLGSLIRAAELADVDDGRIAKSRDRAVDWLGRHFSAARNPGGASWHLYSLMAMRYAVGHRKMRFLGTHDWYHEGVKFLSSQQSPRDGSWRGTRGATTPTISASMALLFLCPLNESALSNTQPGTVTGQVIATKRSKSGRELVEVSIGSDDGVRPNAMMRLFHTDKPDQPIAAIRVALVTPNRCVGFVIERENKVKLGVTDIARLAIHPPRAGKQKSPPPEVNGVVLATKRPVGDVSLWMSRLVVTTESVTGR